MTEDKEKTFHWADYAFFMRWWEDQDETIHNNVRRLVEEDRFVFINGGWVMNDEAVPSYKQALLQMRFGLDIMNHTFGKRATIGWQIDPFGSSSATVSNLHKLGYDAFIENRISEEFKGKLKNTDGFQFYWEGHQVSKDKSNSNLFCYILQYFYVLPYVSLAKGFDELESKYSIYKVYYYEIERAIESFDALSDGKIPEYHVMIPFGDDFSFQKAKTVFKEIEEFLVDLKSLTDSKGYNTTIKYSNLYEYFRILKDQELEFGQFKGDFLPFQELLNHQNDVWTGYYSTKIHLKRQTVHAFNELQTTKLLLAIRVLNKFHSIKNLNQTEKNYIEHIDKNIEEATKVVSLLMHHDGITGTNKRRTEADYYSMLDDALKNLIKSREMILSFNQTIDQDTINEMEQIVSKLDNLEVFHYTIINPNGYERDEILNITLPKSDSNDNYAFVIQHSFESKINTNVTAYKVDLHNMDNDDKKPKVETKAFVKVKVPALGDTQIYLLKFSGGQQKCDEAKIR